MPLSDPGPCCPPNSVTGKFFHHGGCPVRNSSVPQVGKSICSYTKTKTKQEMASASFSPHKKSFLRPKRRPGTGAPERSRAQASAAARFPQETHLGQARPAVRPRGFAGREGLRLAARSAEPDLILSSRAPAQPRRRLPSGLTRLTSVRLAVLTPAGAVAGGRAEARVPEEVRARQCPDTRPRAPLTQSRPSNPGGGDNSPGSGAETSGKGALAAPASPTPLRRCARPPALPVGSPRRLACPGLARAAGR